MDEGDVDLEEEEEEDERDRVLSFRRPHSDDEPSTTSEDEAVSGLSCALNER